jgi:iron complex outermembrane receptor protein
MAISGSSYNNCGQEFVTAQNKAGVRVMNPSVRPYDVLDTQALIDTLSYKLNDALTLRNIASYSLYKHSYSWDMDGSPLNLQQLTTPPNDNSSNTATYTEELQLQGKFRGDALKTVTGIYYETLQPSDKLDGHELGGPGSRMPSGFGDKQVTLSQNLGVTQTVDLYAKTHVSYGPYAQATYNLGDVFPMLDGLNATGGVRYSVDNELGESEIGTYILGFLGTGGTLNQQRVKTEAITWTAGLDYQLPTTLIYGKASHGYKAGGFNDAAVNPENLVFKPELVNSYEVGHKSDFRIGDMPVRVDSAAYYTNYTDMQETSADSYTAGLVPAFGAATRNAGGAKVMGFETDATIIPTRGLTLSLNYSYSYGKFTDYTLKYFSYYGLAIKDCRGTTLTDGDTEHLECLPFSNLPRHQASTTISYQLPVSEAVGRMEPSVTYSFTDRQYSSQVDVPVNDPGAWVGSHGLLNASFDWRSIYGSNFDLHLFGTNLTDLTYRIANSNVWDLFFFQSSIYGEPRMFGAQLTYHWD